MFNAIVFVYLFLMIFTKDSSMRSCLFVFFIEEKMSRYVLTYRNLRCCFIDYV